MDMTLDLTYLLLCKTACYQKEKALQDRSATGFVVTVMIWKIYIFNSTFNVCI